MKKEIKSQDFNYEYTGSAFTEKEIIAKGHSLLTGEELRKLISNKTIYGDYVMGYKFVTDIYDNGTAEGVNHVGSHDFGEWRIDIENNTLILNWKNGWVDTVTRAYEVNGHIEFYDVDTGRWRTTFKQFENWVEE